MFALDVTVSAISCQVTHAGYRSGLFDVTIFDESQQKPGSSEPGVPVQGYANRVKDILLPSVKLYI